MAIVLTQPTLDLYDKISKELKGQDGFLPDPTDSASWSALYEQMLNRPDFRLKDDAALNDTKLHVNNGHLYPPTGTILITDWATSTYETVAYKRVMNDNFTSNAPPTYNGVGNPPGAVLVLDAVGGLSKGPYLTASTHIYLVSNKVTGTVPVPTGGYLAAQQFAAFLRLLQKELAPAAPLVAAGTSVDLVTVIGNSFVPNSQIGNKVTITNAGGAPPELEFSYVVANDATTLTVDPPFTAVVEAGDEYEIEVTFFENYLTEIEKEVPVKALPDGRTEVGTAANLTTLGATLSVAALVKIVGQLGWSVPTEEEDRARKQLGMWTPPFTTLRKTAYTGDMKLYVSNASLLPYPAFDEDLGAIVPETLMLVYPGGTTTVDILRNNRRKSGAGEDSVDLDGALGLDVELPCYVYWVKAADDFAGKKNQFIVSNPTLSPQAAIPGGVGFFEYLQSAKEAVENSTVPT